MRQLTLSIRAMAALFKCHPSHAAALRYGRFQPTRRHKVILREHCRAKLASRAFRESEAMRKLEAEDEALRQAIAWCDSELR